MAYNVSKAEVWVADIPNRPGTLANVLQPLSGVGANLEFMIARKVDDSTSRVFVAPVKGAKQKKAAVAAGLQPASNMFSLRIEGPDKPGLAAKLAQAIADKGINLRGASAAAVGKKAVFYIAIENEQSLKQAMQATRAALGGRC
ncbi:MAG: ACT domain-containing protein [Planctomycetota bacterium]